MFCGCSVYFRTTNLKNHNFKTPKTSPCQVKSSTHQHPLYPFQFSYFIHHSFMYFQIHHHRILQGQLLLRKVRTCSCPVLQLELPCRTLSGVVWMAELFPEIERNVSISILLFFAGWFLLYGLRF